MRLGIDARELSGRPTGVGRYLAALLHEWTRDPVAARHEFVLYSPSPLGGAAASAAARLRALVRVLPGTGGTWWEQAALARAASADRLDVLFAPAYTAPLLATCRVAVTVHDLSYIARPEWFRPRERLRRSWLTWLTVRRAAAVLTISEFSGREVIRLTGVPEAKVHVVHLGLGLDLPGVPPAIPREPLVLYVGSVFNRRRVPDLIRAFGLLSQRRPDARLEIVGENRTWPHEDLGALIAALGLADRVRLRQYVSDEELPLLYARASAFAFLSEYEGFGFTPLEAMARSVPPIVLDTPVAREIYGDAASFVGRGDIEGTATALGRLLDDHAHRDSLLRAAAAVLPRYSWASAARQTLSQIERAARTP